MGLRGPFKVGEPIKEVSRGPQNPVFSANYVNVRQYFAQFTIKATIVTRFRENYSTVSRKFTRFA